MAEKKETKVTYSIEELNQYIIAADRLIDYYVNKAMMDSDKKSPEAARYIHIKEKLMGETEKLLTELPL